MSKVYMSVAARVNYLAADRPDLRQAAKVLCQNMSSPTQADWEKITRVGRYLIRRPRLRQIFKWQARPCEVRVFSDSDWAG